MKRSRIFIAALTALLIPITLAATPVSAGGGDPVFGGFFFVDDVERWGSFGGSMQLFEDELATEWSIGLEAHNTESVEWYVNGELDQKENAEPYYINGDRSGDWNPIEWDPGTYEITVVMYAEDDHRGRSSSWTATVTLLPGINPKFDMVVNTLTDEHDAAPGDGVCGAWVNEELRCTLRAAVEEANATKGAPNIGVPSRSQPYYLDLGDIEITDDVGIIGYGSSKPKIDAQGRSRVFLINASNHFSVLRDLHLLNGNADVQPGGNVAVYDASAWLVDVRLEGGQANWGGGISAGGNSYVQIDRSVITGNRAGRENFGGSGVTQRGGGVSVTGYSQVGIVSSTVSDNNAVRGGGIAVQSGNLQLWNSVVADNAAATEGGGVHLGANAEATIHFSTIAANKAGTSGSRIRGELMKGGGIASYSPSIEVAGTVLSGNTGYDHDKGDMMRDDCWTADAAPLISDRGNIISTLTQTCKMVDAQTGGVDDILFGLIDRPLEVYAGRESFTDPGQVQFFVEAGSPLVDFGSTSTVKCLNFDVVHRERDRAACDAGAFTFD